MTLDELSALLTMCAAHPDAYSFTKSGAYSDAGRPWYALASEDEPVIASFVPLHADAVERLIARANAVPDLLKLLTTQPRLSPELAAAIQRMSKNLVALNGVGDHSHYESALHDIEHTARDVVFEFEAAKGAPANAT